MYPQNVDQLTQYLQEHPEVNVVLPGAQTVYTFKRREGNTIEFVTPDDRLLTMQLEGGVIEYHTNGFTRRVGRFAAELLYTGTKPWQLPGEEKKSA